MSKRTRIASAVLFALLAGCDEPAPVREAVLHPGESITAANKFGTVRVSYVSSTKRRFEWDKQAEVVTMIPREERFMGKLGLYEPAGRFVSLPGDVRLVVQEATRDFEDYGQLYAALYESGAVMDWAYTRDGLVVGFSRTPERGNQIDVDVYQFLVQGRKPRDLKGARDEAVRLARRAN